MMSSNVSNNFTLTPEAAEEVPEPPVPLYTDYIEAAVLVLLFCIGTPLNLYAQWRLHAQSKQQERSQRVSQKAAEFLLLKYHINISDLLILLIFVPTKAGWLLTYSWLAGDAMCRICQFLSMFIFALSSNLMVSVAIDRLFTVKSMKRKNAVSPKRTRIILFFAWLFAVICSVPQLQVRKTFEPFPDWIQCSTIWSVDRWHQIDTQFYLSEWAYSLLHLLIIFWIPCCIVFVCYAVVLRTLLMYSCQQKPGHRTKKDSTHNEVSTALDNNCTLLYSVTPETTNNGGSELKLKTQISRNVESEANGQSLNPADVKARVERTSSHKRRRQFRSNLLRTTAIVVIVHMLCWAPYNIIELIRLANIEIPYSDHLDILRCLITFNAVINPFLYGF